MGCPKIAYCQYSNPAMRCVYNAADGQESYAGTYSYNTTLKDGMYYVHPDHLDSFVTITDATGTIKQKCSFEDYVVSNHWMMHEYGHTFQSRAWGPLYLGVVAVPSAKSFAAKKKMDGYNITTHKFRWYEMSANRHAARYFGIENWDDIYQPRKYYPPTWRKTVPGQGRRRYGIYF